MRSARAAPVPAALGALLASALLAVSFAIAGVATVTATTVPVAVQFSASVQVLWWIAAAVAVLIRTRSECG
ncbi:hypothetical protein GPX89_15325 [Nocardia sp. ET3-3]|uniref:Uncharacterized protein n=1 Tax=Nocardia terrae TaxID=2675851 RepID=A0A7K1UW48_9NOCA|nr:hypothetical protein [Nocardia terrae]MVU78613.1 hypothetical protein [Nocardia terrae]